MRTAFSLYAIPVSIGENPILISEDERSHSTLRPFSFSENPLPCITMQSAELGRMAYVQVESLPVRWFLLEGTTAPNKSPERVMQVPKQVTLNLKSLVSAVAELDDITAKVKASAGTAAERNKKARLAVIESVTVKMPTLPSNKNYDSVVAWVNVVKATADQALDEAVTAELLKSKDDGATGLAALRDSFKAKAETAKALQVMLVSAKVTGAADIVIPTLSGTRGGGTGGGGKTKDSNVQWFIVRADGTRKDMAQSQNKASSVAWYHGAEIGVPDCDGNKGKGCSKDTLFAFLKSDGATIPDSDMVEWTHKASNGVTVGMDVIAKP